MKIKHLTEIIWKVFQNGRPKATAQTIREKDIEQMVKLCYGNTIRDKYLESRKLDKFGEADYSFVSPVLSVKEFALTQANTVGMRRATVDFDVYRLPNNGHITNIYPIGGTCGSDEIGKITAVRNGEEGYFTKSKFKFFLYYVVVGWGFNFYNLPLCVEKVGIETTFDTPDVDVSLDIGFKISLAVFAILWKEQQFPRKVLDNSYDPNAVELKRRLQEQQEQP